MGGHQDHDGGCNANEADPVADEVAFAIQEISQRGPKQGRDDANGRYAGWVVVQLADGIFMSRVAFEEERKERVAGKGLCLSCNDPEHDEAPELPGRENFLDEAQSDGRILLNDRHAGHSQAFLILAEVECRGVARRVWEKGEAVQRNRDGEKAVNDEQPSPAREAAAAIETLMNAGLDEAANHGAGQARRGEDAAALAELALSVPGAEDVVRADKSGGFADALEEANGHDGLRVVHRGGDHGETAPKQHHGGEPDAWLDIVEGEVGRDLAQDVAVNEWQFCQWMILKIDREPPAQSRWEKSSHLPNRKAGVDFIELIAGKAQVFFHSRNIGIGEVRAIKLAGELADLIN